MKTRFCFLKPETFSGAAITVTAVPPELALSTVDPWDISNNTLSLSLTVILPRAGTQELLESDQMQCLSSSFALLPARHLTI